MTVKIKPMLANKLETSHSLIYPVYASPKYDGIRALVIDGVVYSRTLIPIPNKLVQERFGYLSGCDGEIVVGSPTDRRVFTNTQKVVMSEQADTDDIHFYVYDRWTRDIGFDIDILPNEGIYIHRVEHTLLYSPEELDQYTVNRIEEGYEGSITRSMFAPYKFGRSGRLTQELVKWKKQGFSDSEAVVLGVKEGTKISAALKRESDNLGNLKQPWKISDRVPSGMLGSLVCMDIYSKAEFSCGVGFTPEQREQLWKENLIGRTFSYTYQGFVKNKPRFPVFKGWRHINDIS